MSPRRYFRVARLEGREGAVLALYPPEMGDACARFLATTRLLDAAGVRVPEIVAADCAAGWMLVEDIGARTLYQMRGAAWEELLPWMERALDTLGRIRRLPHDAIASLLPPLGEAVLKRELRQTWELYLLPRGLAGDEALQAELGAALDSVCERLGAGPLEPCHRDFMARNLVPLAEERRLAVLDHQDLRLGPRGYDLASLLNDSLFPPPEVEAQLLRAAAPLEVQAEEYRRCVAQRSLKAIGTFAAFAQRGADRHLPLVPFALGRALAALRALPEGAAVATRLAPLWEKTIC